MGGHHGSGARRLGNETMIDSRAALLGEGRAEPSKTGTRGFTLVELVLALTVLTLSVGAVTSTLATTRSMGRVQS